MEPWRPGGSTYQTQAKRMLANMIELHCNHPSVIPWGMGNENDWHGDFAEFDKEKIWTLMKELNDLSHSIWAGWYRGEYKEYKEVSRNQFERVDHFLHVEWGGDSHARRHSENPDDILSGIATGRGADERTGDAALYRGSTRASKDGDWIESYIVNLIDWHLKEQETMDWLTGTTLWLCGEGSKFVTGIVVPINGGFSSFSGV